MLLRTIDIFIDEGVDGEVLSCLTENALQTLVTRVGPRMKILKAVKNMDDGLSSTSGSVSGQSECSGSWQNDDDDDDIVPVVINVPKPLPETPR